MNQGFLVFYIVESSKSFAEAIFDLEPVVQRLGFVVLHSHNVGETLLRKGIEFDEECQVFEILNYRYAEKMLSGDMLMGLTLPWRITIYTENSATKIGVIRPEAMLAVLKGKGELAKLAAEIEEKLMLIVDETR